MDMLSIVNKHVSPQSNATFRVEGGSKAVRHARGGATARTCFADNVNATSVLIWHVAFILMIWRVMATMLPFRQHG